MLKKTTELKKDKNGIQIFILDDENSTFKPYRSVIVVEGSIEEFESILKDIPNISFFKFCFPPSCFTQKQ